MSATVRKIPSKAGAAAPVKKKPVAAAAPPLQSPSRSSPSARAAEDVGTEAPSAPKKKKRQAEAEPEVEPEVEEEEEQQVEEAEEAEAGEAAGKDVEMPDGLQAEEEEEEEEAAAAARPPASKVVTKPAAPPTAMSAGACAMKDAILNKYKGSKRKKVVTQLVKTGGGTLPTMSFIGVVLESKPIQVKGKSEGQKVPKIECVIEVLKVRSNNAIDAIVSGVDGAEWILPTFQEKAPANGANGAAAQQDAADDAPDGARGDKKAAANPPRYLKFADCSHKTVWLGGALRKLSFYTQKPGNANEEKEGIGLIVPGMIVEVTGVTAALSENGQTLWLNATGITPKLDGIVPGRHEEAIMTAMSRPEVMAADAFRMSQCVRGFYGANFADKPEYEQQAKVFRDKWIAARDGTSGACEAKAMYLRSEMGQEGEALAAILDKHAKRLKEEKPEDLAYGKPFFNPMLAVTGDRPAWTAGIVVKGLTPEYPRHEMIWSLIGGPSPQRDALPETFVAAEPIDASVQGAVINVMLRLNFIGSKAAAIAALENGTDPVLDTGDYAAAAVKINLRSEPHRTGITVLPKLEAFCTDLYKYGTWWAAAGCTPREYTDTTVASVFPSTHGVDMVKSLDSITIKVSEEWVKTNLALGEGTFTYERDPTFNYIKGPDKKNDLSVADKDTPTIKRDYYQMCLEKNWRFKHALMPADAPVREYRLWYEGVCTELAESPELSNDEAAAEQLIADVVSQMPDCSGSTNPPPLNCFLMKYCVLYCVARPAPAPAEE